MMYKNDQWLTFTMKNGKELRVLTEKASEDAGYATGLLWTEKHRPGGPFIFKSYESDEQAWIDYAKASLMAQRAWLTGFDRGLAGQSHALHRAFEEKENTRVVD